MALETPRLKLVKPDTSELADINVLNNNFDKIDANPGVYICTSSTRPTSPFEGQEIYETDTNSRLFWDGSAWVVSYAQYASSNTASGWAIRADAVSPENNWYLIRTGPLVQLIGSFQRTGSKITVSTASAGAQVISGIPAAYAPKGLDPHGHRVLMGTVLHSGTQVHAVGLYSSPSINIRPAPASPDMTINTDSLVYMHLAWTV